MSLQKQFPLRNMNSGLKLYSRPVIKRLNRIYSITTLMWLEEDCSLEPIGISIMALGTDSHPSCCESYYGRYQTTQHHVTALHWHDFEQPPPCTEELRIHIFPLPDKRSCGCTCVSPKAIPICHRAISPACGSGSSHVEENHTTVHDSPWSGVELPYSSFPSLGHQGKLTAKGL